MIARHTFTYLGSRAVAAALNMASLAVFTRLAPAETYGTYLLVLSWAMVLYGATCQWPKFAFFALYEEQRAPEQVATVVRILLGTVALAALCAAAAAGLGFVDGRTAAAVVAATFGMTLFEGSVELARTRLAAEAVGATVVARALLILGLGSLALHWTGDPLDLVLAVAVANTLAAVPAGLSIWPLIRSGRGSLADARRLLAYGWPLVLSFGLAALAQSIDRIIIGKAIGAEELGAYGAIADFLRQSFIVFGDSIALSLVSIAKRDAREGGLAAARPVLREAARALTVIGAFGAVFFLSFDHLVVDLLLGPDYRAPALALAPLLIVVSILTMFRGYYFGQVIYFTDSSAIEAVACAAMLVATAGLSLALIPDHGTKGAALALAIGQAVACLVYVLGAKGRFRMPFPLAEIGLITLSAIALWAVLASIALLPQAHEPLGIATRLAVFGLGALAAIWHFNIAGMADSFVRWSRRFA